MFKNIDFIQFFSHTFLASTFWFPFAKCSSQNKLMRVLCILRFLNDLGNFLFDQYFLLWQKFTSSRTVFYKTDPITTVFGNNPDLPRFINLYQ